MFRFGLLAPTSVAIFSSQPALLRFLNFSLLSSIQLRQEKVQLEQTLEQEQEQQISKLTKKIERLEKETLTKQATLEQVIPSFLFFNNVPLPSLCFSPFFTPLLPCSLPSPFFPSLSPLPLAAS